MVGLPIIHCTAVIVHFRQNCHEFDLGYTCTCRCRSIFTQYMEWLQLNHIFYSQVFKMRKIFMVFFVVFFGRQINGGRSQQSFLNYRSFWGRQSQSDFLDKFSRSFHFCFYFQFLNATICAFIVCEIPLEQILF